MEILRLVYLYGLKKNWFIVQFGAGEGGFFSFARFVCPSNLGNFNVFPPQRVEL